MLDSRGYVYIIMNEEHRFVWRKRANPKSTGLSMCCTDEHIAILFIVYLPQEDAKKCPAIAYLKVQLRS